MTRNTVGRAGEQLTPTYHHLSRPGNLFIYEAITHTHHTLRLSETRQTVTTPHLRTKLIKHSFVYSLPSTGASNFLKKLFNLHEPYKYINHYFYIIILKETPVNKIQKSDHLFSLYLINQFKMLNLTCILQLQDWLDISYHTSQLYDQQQKIFNHIINESQMMFINTGSTTWFSHCQAQENAKIRISQT